ncbi:unnamed protein product [Rotaria sp. Silwood2]|nr:unnamed protein product [Rotaria sp. Silwood2]
MTATSATALRQAGAYYGRSLSRRAVLTVPSSDWKKLTKLPTFTNTDCVVLDLEDGVAETAKQIARENIFRYLNESASKINREICVRINSMSSNHINDDVKLLKDLSTSIDCLFVPKVESVDEMKWLADHLGTNRQYNLVLYCESARSLVDLRSILTSASSLFSLQGVVFGSDDFSADVGINGRYSLDAVELTYARQKLVTICRLFENAQPIDMVYINFKDLDGLKKQSEQGAAWGFTGKQVIHPQQVPIVQAAFSPSESSIIWAKELIQAFEKHEKEEGKGAFTFREIKSNSIVTRDGDEYPVDIIIWSTGFQVQNFSLPVYGTNNCSLKEKWSETFQAFRGVTVPSFPNLFFLLGPNTGLGHNSILVMIEAQINYTAEALLYMDENNIQMLDVKQKVHDEYNQNIQSKLKKTVWQSGGCYSWYQDAKGNNTAIWPGFTWTYILFMKHFDPKNYIFQ